MVDASADTWSFRNTADGRLTAQAAARKLAATEYLRPTPAPSDYLHTAANPVVWTV